MGLVWESAPALWGQQGESMQPMGMGSIPTTYILCGPGSLKDCLSAS